MKRLIPVSFLWVLTAVTWLSSCATHPTAHLNAKTEEVLTAMCDKLAAAKTLRVTTTRNASPGFHVGVDVSQSATGVIVVQRPNQLAAQIKSSKGERSVGFDGHRLIIVDHAAATHSEAKAEGDLDATVLAVQQTYGVTPPVAELLVNHPKQHLLSNVKSAQYLGTQTIAGVVCDRLAFEQDRLSWQLWVATGDKLPRRIAFSYPNGEGGPPLTVNATMTKWELNVPLTTADFSVNAPAHSRAIDMIPLSP